MGGQKRLKTIVFLVPYPIGNAPSQRFRFEQYIPILQHAGFELHIYPFLDEKVWKILYQPGKFGYKIFKVLQGFIKRKFQLIYCISADYVFVHREIAPFGPPIFEWILCKLFRKKVIFDFDDAIWIPNTTPGNKFFSRFKRYENALYLMQHSFKNSCGNHYLQQKAAQFNPNSFYVPTTIDTQKHHNILKQNFNKKQIIFGWTGTLTTMDYLIEILPIMDDLIKKYSFKLLIISNQKPSFKRDYIQFRYWNKETEIEDLLKMDVGLMPLRKDVWSEGKCGFKALQYLALGIPAIASDVGVNAEIVETGKTGYLCQNVADWYKAFEYFITKAEQIQQFSLDCREKIENNYSVQAHQHQFLTLFEPINQS
jgi:glycosyltransferase involved in cell wall biosynthesis